LEKMSSVKLRRMSLTLVKQKFKEQLSHRPSKDCKASLLKKKNPPRCTLWCTVSWASDLLSSRWGSNRSLITRKIQNSSSLMISFYLEWFQRFPKTKTTSIFTVKKVSRRLLTISSRFPVSTTTPSLSSTWYLCALLWFWCSSFTKMIQLKW
jgi:hypothetical protein